MAKGYRYIGILILCAVFLVGCRPKGVLSSHKMRVVLVDLHKTEAMLQVAGLGIKDQDIKSIYYAQVLERHGVTQAEFDSSLVWYTAHPQLFDKIYPKVMADLKKEEEKYVALLAEQEGGEVQKETKPIWPYTQLNRPCWDVPLMHDSVNQLFPEISVFRAGVIDTLQTGVSLP